MELNRISFKGDELLSCLLSVTTESFAVLDVHGVLHEVNKAFCIMTGLTRQELVGRSLFELTVESGSSGLKDLWLAICNFENKDVTFLLHNAKGKDKPVQANFFPHKSPELTFVCLFCKEVAVSPEKMELFNLQTEALASTSNAVVITDADGVIVWANRAFSKYTGYTLGEAVGNQPGELLKSGKHPQSFYEEMWETIRRGDTWQGEIFNRRKDGTLYPEEMTITPLFNGEGRITHYIAIKQDVSEKKNLQEMFLRAQRLESVGTLASGVAHDLNNVLSPIVMSSDLLMVQTRDAHTKEMLLMIKDSAKRGADIIRQLLTFVRGDDDELVELQIRHVLKDLVKVFRETFPRYITIEDRIASDLLPVFGNATNLHQVFTNLMINARDAMPKGGTLLLKVDNVILNEEEASGIPEGRPGHYVKIKVQDEGVGIPEEMYEDIFTSFFTTKEIGKGTGLGLPTAMRIIKKHRGFLTMFSEVDKGTSFDVYLPVFEGALSPQQKAPVENIPYGNGECVLVIDDEKSIGYMLKGTLKSLNYKVEIVEGGKAGIAWWKENRDKCDIILLDMMMPEMDGADVYQELMKLGYQSEILIMSGMVSEEKLIETGVDLDKSFISKPFQIVELARKIRSLLDD